MANTYITSGSRFTPFTFDEMIKPALLYKEAYEAAETKLDTILEDAADKGFGFKETDPEKQIYDDFMSDLQDLSEQFGSSGFNHQLSKELKDLHKYYKTTLVPIQKKLTKREELAKEQADKQALNPSLRFDKDYSTMSLSDVEENPTYTTYNLDYIKEQAYTQMAAHVLANPRDPEVTPIMGGMAYMTQSGYGYTPEDYEKKLKDGNSEVFKLQEKLRNSFATSNPKLNDEIKEAISQGMRASIGTVETEFKNLPTGYRINDNGEIVKISGSGSSSKKPENKGYGSGRVVLRRSGTKGVWQDATEMYEKALKADERNKKVNYYPQVVYPTDLETNSPLDKEIREEILKFADRNKIPREDILLYYDVFYSLVGMTEGQTDFPYIVFKPKERIYLSENQQSSQEGKDEDASSGYTGIPNFD